MANKSSASKKRTTSSKTRTGAKLNTGRKAAGRAAKGASMPLKLRIEIQFIVMLAVAVLFEISAFGGLGALGYYLSFFMFGMVGLIGYIFPALVVAGVIIFVLNINKNKMLLKFILGCILVVLVCALIQLITRMNDNVTVGSLYMDAGQYKNAGGLIGGGVALMLYSLIGKVGAFIVVIAAIIVIIIVLSEKSLLGGVTEGSRYVRDKAEDKYDRLKDYSEERHLERERNRELRRARNLARKKEDEERKTRLENERKRYENKGKGVLLNPLVADNEPVDDGMKEITLDSLNENEGGVEGVTGSGLDDFSNFPYESDNGVENNDSDEFYGSARKQFVDDFSDDEDGLHNVNESRSKKYESGKFGNDANNFGDSDDFENENATNNASNADSGAENETLGLAGAAKAKKEKAYKYPPKSLLKRPERGKGVNNQELSETAAKLQQTLANFGVRVTITDVSKGPSVTRYEMQPEMGIKVSKITALADDIKLNLAASDIRIEAPIPGKAAVGIEVPNNGRDQVLLRELLESPELKNHPSKLAFASGKDISGKVVVADIAKMPHMLVAGTTGSGKSVFMNSIIMTILYRAKPSEVKMLIIDPKVVEFGVYNGIPHLLHPVITNPKNAAAALSWAVAEMTRRYQLLADFNVRDFKGYNEKVDNMEVKEGEEKPEKMPQIVIVIDELADLMMVAAKAVEESICRLAQLARAAGIHLIIATQRPSVDVVTGLIKANVPSRVALLVSSGVDSRTIIDMNGAEKLLGNGDMLFYPSGYVKPVRVQGAFVSDEEVANVVDFLKKNDGNETYDESISEHISNDSEKDNASEGAGKDEENLKDAYFVDAGRLVIEMDKASSSMLQRRFRIGFNRAARIIDELYDMGVIGPDEGSKPRKVLMSMEDFENLISSK